MPKQILLVEDDENDICLFKEAVSELGIDTQIEVCTDGRKFSERIKMLDNIPDLIFLDLNLPYVTGQELLQQLQRCPEWRRVPVCILSSSKTKADVLLTYSRQANCHIAKPLDYKSFLQVVSSVLTFWFETAELPDNASRP